MEKVEENTFSTSLTNIANEQKGKKKRAMSAFKFNHGLPIKDSDKDSFSR